LVTVRRALYGEEAETAKVRFEESEGYSPMTVAVRVRKPAESLPEATKDSYPLHFPLRRFCP
jgi:hypothetical protein